MLESVIILLLLNNYNYNRYNKYIYNKNNINNIRINNKYIYKLLISIKELKDKYNKELNSVEELVTVFHTLYPVLTQEESHLYEEMFQKIVDTTVSKELAEEFLVKYCERIASQEITLMALSVVEGKEEYGKLVDLVTNDDFITETTEEDDFVDSTLENLHATLVAKVGLRWRLNTLNKSLGSLRRGNFGFIAARPEVGKTAFLTSEVSHMASQATGNIIHINNEEANEQVLFRYYMAVLGKTKTEILVDRRASQEAYIQATGDRIKLFGKPFAGRREIESVLKKYNPELIVIDQLDKVAGFEGDRNDLILKEKYQWARELAKEYGPVIGVCQAGGTGENKRYLDMNDIDSSHTAKQGEADWILGIGKDSAEGYETHRFFNIMKNKLIGDEDTLPELRHMRMNVKILPEISRYEDAQIFDN